MSEKKQQNSENNQILQENLKILKTKKPEVLALLGEMSVRYLSNNEIEYSKNQLDKITYQLDILRQIVLNA